MSKETLEIHHITVGGGDCTAIVLRNEVGEIVRNALIDAGAEKSGANDMYAYICHYRLFRKGTVKRYVKKGGVEEEAAEEVDRYFDYFIASHYHSDHVEGFSKFCQKDNQFYFGRFIDIGTDSSALPGCVGKRTNIKHRDCIGRIEPTSVRPTNLLPDFITPSGGDAKVYHLGDTITLTCFAGGGLVADAKQGVKGGRAIDAIADVDPNEYSLAFILEWNGFRYFTAGDLCGKTETKLAETLTAAGLAKVDVFKANHHGSNGANGDEILRALNPEVIVVPCNIGKQVPGTDFMRRALRFSKAKPALLCFANDYSCNSIDQEKITRDLDYEIAHTNLRLCESEGSQVFTNFLGEKRCAAIVVVVKGKEATSGRPAQGGPVLVDPAGTLPPIADIDEFELSSTGRLGGEKYRYFLFSRRAKFKASQAARPVDSHKAFDEVPLEQWRSFETQSRDFVVKSFSEKIALPGSNYKNILIDAKLPTLAEHCRFEEEKSGVAVRSDAEGYLKRALEKLFAETECLKAAASLDLGTNCIDSFKGAYVRELVGGRRNIGIYPEALLRLSYGKRMTVSTLRGSFVSKPRKGGRKQPRKPDPVPKPPISSETYRSSPAEVLDEFLDRKKFHSDDESKVENEKAPGDEHDPAS